MLVRRGSYKKIYELRVINFRDPSWDAKKMRKSNFTLTTKLVYEVNFIYLTWIRHKHDIGITG